MKQERPIIFIYQEERIKLFFHSLIVHLESIGFVQGEVGRMDEGRYSERMLHYWHKSYAGYTEVELHVEDDRASIELNEFGVQGEKDKYHQWACKLDDYDAAEWLTKLDSLSSAVDF